MPLCAGEPFIRHPFVSVSVAPMVPLLVTASAYVAINLVTDLLYGLFDPRIRY